MVRIRDNVRKEWQLQPRVECEAIEVEFLDLFY